MAWFTDLFSHQARPYTTLFLPKERVDREDYDDNPVKAGAVYCKLWLVSMHLAKDIEWGEKRYPIVHAATSYHYGTSQITVPYIADGSFLNELTSLNRDRVIALNYELTPLFPFKKGTVIVRAGLLSLITSSILQSSLQVMGQLSSILPATAEFTKVLKMAEPLGSGLRDLLNLGDRRLELGYLQTYAEAGSGGSNGLRAGYFVAIQADEGIIDTQSLCIVQDKLRIGAQGKNREFVKQHQPFLDHSYMLFRFEVRKERDWHELDEIETLVNNVREALIRNKQDEAKKVLLPTLQTAIIRSPDIVEDDRYPMFSKVRQALERIGPQGTGREVPFPSLQAIMEQPMPPRDHQSEAEFARLQALFGDN